MEELFVGKKKITLEHSNTMRVMDVGPARRLVFLKNKEVQFEKQINTYIMDTQCKVLDVTMLEWDRIDRQYYLGMVVEEQMKFFRQNCLLLEQRRPDDLTKDLDDFSSVMVRAKNVEYRIEFIRTFALMTPRGIRYYAFVFYED
ncbi:MAG: hypothetical protein GX052_06875 [Syntrophomonadaceae bacterium]|jgi:hypothetical protein|nr:hypothetical protein [Syntrophomonadaceae bacterium]